ncbi:MAG: hypothetical protein Q9187_009222, partial [Circinaria calcarea]
MADFDTMVLSTEAALVANSTSPWVPINLTTKMMPAGIKNHVDNFNSKSAMSEANESNSNNDKATETKESNPVPKTPKKEKAVKAPATPKTAKTVAPLKETATSKKRASDTVTEDDDPITPKKPRTPTGKGMTSSDGEEVDVGEGSSHKHTAPTGTIAAPRSIPKSWNDATEADRELYNMKEAGKGWEEIRKMWKEKTGQDAAASTLPNRYSRLK